MGLPRDLDTVPTYRERGGRMYIETDDFTLTMSMAVAIEGHRRMGVVIEEWRQQKRGEVIQLEARHFGH